MACMATHDHPLFTRLYGVIAGLEDDGPVGAARTTVAGHLAGRTLIVGLGPGFDLLHLPDSVTEVIAVEPSASMRRAAHDRVTDYAKSRPIRVIDAVAEDLPLADASIDSILFAYVLCTVDDPSRAMAEARRVLRPGGVVAVMEHVRGAPGSWSGRAQRVVSRIWPHVAGGCHCDRDTRAAFADAGFDTSDLTDTVLVNVPPVAPAVVGTVRPH